MVQRATGAVTFLFTDIEGSTRLLKQLRAGYADVLAEHQRLLRQAFAAHSGDEVDTAGDGFFVAFGSARDAVLAAVEGQMALLTHRWPDDVQLKVRMGIHTGQAASSEGGYTGLAVHRAARIMAAAHGGQVLVSQATQTLLEDEEEDLHIFLRDLGEQRLKDLDRPVRLYQAGTDGLPEMFPPLRHEAQLAEVAEHAVAQPARRRRLAQLVAGALLVLALAAAAALLLTRSGKSGLAGVDPNHVGVIDPASNRIVADVPTGIRPGPVAVGNGSVWVGNLDDRTLTRIDLRQRTATATVSLGNRTPTGVAVGQGGVWVAHGLRGQVSRVDPQYNRVTRTLDVASAETPSLHGAVAVGAGAVWAVFGDSTFARIDAADTRVTELTHAGGDPAALVIGSRSVWVANSDGATVSRYNPATFAEGPTRTTSIGRRAQAIAWGEGAIWVADAGDDAVTRIDPSTSATRTIAVGDEPIAVAAGAGAVWVANRASRTVSRIDPASGEVVRTIEVGNAPSGIAVGGGAVWVAAQAP